MSTRTFRAIRRATKCHFQNRASHGSQPASDDQVRPERGEPAPLALVEDRRRDGDRHRQAEPKVPAVEPCEEAELPPQPRPAGQRALGERVVVAGREQQQVALLLAVERLEPALVDLVRRRSAGERRLQDAIDQARHAEREDRVHVVPQLPLGEHAGRVALLAGAEPVGEVVEERIEVVVLNDEQPAGVRLRIVQRDPAGHLHPHGRLAGALFAEDDRRGRLGRVAVDLVPHGMIGRVAAALLEDRVGLRVFLRERIDRDAVVFEQLLDAHEESLSVVSCQCL